MKLFAQHICMSLNTEIHKRMNECVRQFQTNTHTETYFNECLIQNHFHAYRAYEIIAIIFYCGLKTIFLLVCGNVCVEA